MDNLALVNRFYQAFSENDGKTMADFYDENATFQDDVFGKLNAAEVKAMWQMLTARSKDLVVTWTEPGVQGEYITTHWTAQYSFGPGKRKVVNEIDAQFLIRDGKIVQHKDHFNFYRWARQALGLPGLTLGWTSYLRHKVSNKALKGLRDYMSASMTK